MSHGIIFYQSDTCGTVDSTNNLKRPGVGGLNLAGGAGVTSEVVIVHSGVVVTLLYLLPSLHHHQHPRLSALLQLYTAHLIKVIINCVLFVLIFVLLYFVICDLSATAIK